jgi:hypothetical protein
MMKQLIAILLSISIGIIFIISAFSKLFPIEPFEYQLVDVGWVSWKMAPIWARLLIGMEFFIGMLFVFQISLKKFTIKFATFILSVFTSYLMVKIAQDGNTGNCGCFGEIFKMNPLQGIIKNGILFISCWTIYFALEREYWSVKLKQYLFPILIIVSMLIGFLVNPIYANRHSSIDTSAVNYKVPLELMYSSKQKETPKIDLNKGKHIIAFLSLTCSHCRIAAKKLHVINKKNPSLPIYVALNGNKQLEADFVNETQIQTIPHNLFLGPNDWMQVAGIQLPIILFVNNGIVEKKINGVLVEQATMEQWLKQ